MPGGGIEFLEQRRGVSTGNGAARNIDLAVHRDGADFTCGKSSSGGDRCPCALGAADCPGDGTAANASAAPKNAPLKNDFARLDMISCLNRQMTTNL